MQLLGELRRHTAEQPVAALGRRLRAAARRHAVRQTRAAGDMADDMLCFMP